MVVLLCGVTGCATNPDSLVQEEIKDMNALADAMEQKDDARVKEMQKKLEATGKRLRELMLSGEATKKLLDRHNDEFQKALARLNQAGTNRAIGGQAPGSPGVQGPKMPGRTSASTQGGK
jgi:hypothetical protein